MPSISGWPPFTMAATRSSNVCPAQYVRTRSPTVKRTHCYPQSVWVKLLDLDFKTAHNDAPCGSAPAGDCRNRSSSGLSCQIQSPPHRVPPEWFRPLAALLQTPTCKHNGWITDHKANTCSCKERGQNDAQRRCYTVVRCAVLCCLRPP